MSLTNPNEYSFVAIADVHLKDNESIGDISENGLSFRTIDKLDALQKAIDYSLCYGTDAFIILGDLCDSTHISERLRYEIFNKLKDLILSGIEVFIVGGNHDTNDNRIYNFLSESVLSDGLYLADNLMVETKKGIDLLFLSSGKEKELETIKISKPTILLAHCQVIGAKYDDERLSKTFIEPKLFAQFKATYLGHFHKRQSGSNYSYIGALCKNSFGEKNNKDGFIFVKTKNGEIVTEKYISIDDREFIQIERGVSSNEEIYTFVKDLNLENKIVKIIFKLKDEFILHPKKIKEFLKLKNPFHIKIEYENEYVPISNNISSTLNYMDVFDKYVKLNNISHENVKIGNQILEEVFRNN